jgi:hypothetical protein
MRDRPRNFRLIETRDERGGRLDAAAIASVIDGVILGDA